MITLRNITLQRGANILLQNMDWTIFPKQRIGLIGANGSGKTSLFALIRKTLQPDQGDLFISSDLKIGYVAQETPAKAQSALSYVLEGDDELNQLQIKLQEAERSLDGTAISLLHEALQRIDAYTAPARAGQLLTGLGFSHKDQQKAVSAFSGGFRIRLNLAKALMCRSDLLLLDEPTNHLDLDAILWLEEYLKKYSGTLILISHDRDFLDQTVDQIAYLSQQKIKSYAGNYSAFEKARAAEMLLHQATYEKQQEKLKHMQAFVDRFRAKATKARQAQSRLKAIERMDLVCALQTTSPFQFEFKQAGPCPNPLIKLESARIAYANQTVFENLILSIAPKERIAILGPNGAGKSTLLKVLAGEIDLSSSEREASSGIRIGYFAQHQIDTLHLSESPLSHLQAIADKTPLLELRKFLGSFGFSGDRVFEPVRHFSGGEKSRLALALLVWQRPNLLLLDEPTNHLDLEMRQALSLALQEYDGALILVTHDRFLVRTTTDKLLLVAEKRIRDFDGDLKDYQQWLFNFRKQQSMASFSECAIEQNNFLSSKKKKRQEDAKERDRKRPLLQKIKQLEDELAKRELEAAELNILLADHSLYEPCNKEILQKHLMTQVKIKKEREQLEQAWFKACEERDKLG